MTYDEANIFAKILRGEIPCDVFFENDSAMAFRDISPAAPSHLLIIPKCKATSFDDFVQRFPDQVADFFEAVQHVAQQENLVESGYRLITNHAGDANQTVAHFHVHLLGGKNLGGLLSNDDVSSQSGNLL